MTNQTAFNPSMMFNLSTYHHEHEKYYAYEPLEKAQQLQQASRILLTLADRWSEIEPGTPKGTSPYMGADDLNERSTIQHTGVLFLEGEGEPPEILHLKRDIRTMADDLKETGGWLNAAMETSWEMVRQLVHNPLLAGVLGERHRIVANDWQNAAMCGLSSRLLYRALEILEAVDLSTASVRADLAGPRFIPRYLYSAAELTGRAADLVATSATVVNDNERRWRVFRRRVQEVVNCGEARQANAHREGAVDLSAAPVQSKAIS